MNEQELAYLAEWGYGIDSPRSVYKVPAIFYLDHKDRGCGLTDKVIEVKGNRVTVELDQAGYADLLSDAKYYYECRDEIEMPALCNSAKRTIATLDNKGDK
jgi:hypothetical protein